jgi:hypothetical protein
MSFLKSTIRKVLPRQLVTAYQVYRQAQLSRRNSRMTTEEVFTDIYARNRWGGQSGTFCSGDGSREAEIVSPYLRLVNAELDRLGARSMSVVDLGCGDYSVGRHIAPSCGRYVGVDIVKPLVERNQALFGGGNVAFTHANIVEDDLPAGDICFVRQVLQHLSNAQIAAVLPKLTRFTWCFITEHHPSPDKLREPNRDKPHGDSIRVSRGSGVFLDRPPFAIDAGRYRLLLEVPGIASDDAADPGIIRTYLLENERVGIPSSV